MADSVATRVARHRAKKRANDVTRLTIELDRETVGAIRRLCKRHGKTQRQFLELAVQAADSLLAGRLQLARIANQLPARVTMRAEPQKRPQRRDQTPSNTDTPVPLEKSPVAPLYEPTKPMVDDADARIRSAATGAWRVEP